MKKSVYVETSVLSYLTSKPARELVNAARQQSTRDWWDSKREDFNLYISQAVIVEAAAGDPEAAAKRLDLLKQLALVEMTPDAVDLADFLVQNTPFPINATLDALHIAIASTSAFDFILTWNFKHIANANIRSKLEVLVQSKGFRLPVICTPEELLF